MCLKAAHAKGAGIYPVFFLPLHGQYVVKDSELPTRDSTAGLLLEAIVASCDDAIVSKDLNGTITSWNKAAERIFGYKAEEVIGGPISIIIPPERGHEELDILQRIRRGESIDHFETVRMRRDGTLVEVSITISPIRYKGQVIGASKIARDISERKKIQDELDQHRARLEVTLASIGDGVIVTDRNGMIVFMNPVAEGLTGWTLDHGRGQMLEAVFNIVNEATRLRVENPVARALREGVTVGLANHTLLIARDGAERAIDDSAAPIRNGTNEVLGVVLVFRDVSGSRAAEDSRARLAAIVESSDDAIIGKDLSGRITSWNNAATQLFGYTAAEAIGRSISMLIPPDRLHEEVNILESLRRGQRIRHFETVRLTKDRRQLNISLTVSPIRDGEGNVVGASKIARDITDRKRTETELTEARERLLKYSQDLEKTVAERTAQLRDAYSELETFTYSVAHDLRAPLGRMQNLLTALQDDLGAGLASEPSQLLQRCIRGAERMAGLVEDLLKLAQVGKQLPQLELVPLNRLVEQAIAELKQEAQGRTVEWTIAQLASVQCDSGLIRQVWINLLSNALKYTRPRAVSKIEIGQTSVNGQLAFYVADNGVGFRMDEAADIFTAFHRLHSQREFEGSGIGLATVARIVRKHGGQVWAEAEPGQGARFYFTLDKASDA